MITSVNLAPIPFQSNTDSTRLQMSSKQIQQALTHPNCEIPFVIGENHFHVSNNSTLGIYKAKDSGRVIFSNEELLILQYDNIEPSLDIKLTPPVKLVYANYGSKLRYKLKYNETFTKNQVIYEYDCFRNGLVSCGYNVFTAYMPWFGFNHEDGIVISENFANKAQCTFIDKLYIPIYDHTLLEPIYKNFKYVPGAGEKIKHDIVCTYLLPRKYEKHKTNIDPKVSMINWLKSQNLSHLNNITTQQIESVFKKRSELSKVENGLVSGIKIHKIGNTPLIIPDLEQELKKLYQKYDQYVVGIYHELSQHLPLDLTKEILYRYFIYKDKDLERYKLDMRNVVYLLEVEITKTEKTNIGDKLTNMYAGKGVVCQIIPEELRPISKSTENPIDLIFNPFGVFSRMNLGQIVNGMISKTVHHYDKAIRSNPNNVKNFIKELNNIIYNLDEDYHNEINNEIIAKLDNKEFKTNFLNNIGQNNLYIEGKAFCKLNINELNKKLIPANESVIIKSETLKYLKQKLKIDLGFTINGDIEIKNIFCIPSYIMKLSKLSNKIINARDLGPVQGLTGQPTKGRAKQGGSKLGQMEIESIIAHGCERCLKELMTVKSDCKEEKKNMAKQIATTGEYNMNNIDISSGQTKKIVDTLINFLKD